MEAQEQSVDELAEVASTDAAWPDVDAPVGRVDGLPGQGHDVDFVPSGSAKITIGLDELALRDAVASYLESRVLRGGTVESVRFEAGAWQAVVVIGGAGRRSEPAFEFVGDASTQGRVDALADLIDERRERREAAHERMLAKSGRVLRARS